MSAADYSWGINVTDLRDSDFCIITEADMALLEFACTAVADEIDYSEFYLDEGDE